GHAHAGRLQRIQNRIDPLVQGVVRLDSEVASEEFPRLGADADGRVLLESVEPGQDADPERDRQEEPPDPAEAGSPLPEREDEGEGAIHETGSSRPAAMRYTASASAASPSSWVTSTSVVPC